MKVFLWAASGDTLGREGEVTTYPIIIPFLSRGELPPDESAAQLSTALRREFDHLRERPLNTSEAGNTMAELFRLAADGENEAVRAKLEQPVKYLRERMQGEPSDARGWAQLGLMEALSGHPDEARRCVEKALALGPDLKDAWFGPGFRINVAHAYAWAGDKDSALREYARLLQTPLPWGRESGALVINVHAMRRHPALAPLRGDARFEALLNDPKNNAPLF